MKVSLLQLNMFAGTYWDRLSSFLTSHDFDVIHLQEVAGKHTKVGVVDTQIDCYVELQKLLHDRYDSEFVLTDRFTSSPESYTGNAIFYKKQWSLIEKDILWLHQNHKPYPSDATSYEDTGKALLRVTLSKAGKTMSFLNTHGAWAKNPKEHSHQTKQGDMIVEYLKTTATPYILSGDFNLNPEQPTIKKLGEIAQNLTSEHHVTNTLNPRTHYATHMFPPGVTVDYIFTSKDIMVKSFSVVEDDISDHLGLVAEFEI